jgi:peptidoglycan/xylan/chitin deacetylase (PgdA/CDA1 family)
MADQQDESSWTKNPWYLRILANPYFVKTPWWLAKYYSSYTWKIKTDRKVLYLSFDDGPHPIATVFVLDQLKKYNAKASFFCIGKNVVAHPRLYKRILDEGHSTGNHTQHHLNGWKTSDDEYLLDIAEAANHIKSNLFRPPYGRIKRSQGRKLGKAMHDESAKVIMWTVLSGDFDDNLSKEKCLAQSTRNVEPGSIIVFHDSEKAFSRLAFTLPRLLEYFSKQGFTFEKLGCKTGDMRLI